MRKSLSPININLNCKIILTLIILGFFIQSAISQTKFLKDDINGVWQSTKIGAEIFINISGTQATITSVGNTTLTKNIISGFLYEDIKYEGNGVWIAQRNSWIYNGVNGNNSESGHWEKGGILKLTLSQDKNTLSASGHWIFKKSIRTIGNPMIKDSSDMKKQTLMEDFGGLNGKFTLVTRTNDSSSLIVVQLSNKTSNQLASVLLKTDDGKMTVEYIYPDETLTKKYDSKSLEIQVLYQDWEKPKPEFKIMDFVKDLMRTQVENKKGTLTSIGVRG